MNEYLFSTIRSKSLKEKIKCLELVLKYEQLEKHRKFLEEQLDEAIDEYENSIQIPVRTKEGREWQDFVFISSSEVLRYYREKAIELGRSYPIIN